MTFYQRYLDTHPWLTFEVNLKTLDPFFWMLLGEAQSKCDHIAGAPLRPSIQKDLHLLYLAKGIAATTAIEGNTLTEEEVLKIINKELALPPSKQYLAQEVKNIEDACNDISKSLLSGSATSLCADEIKNFNRMVLNGLNMEDHIRPGKIRNYPVGVLRYKGAPAEDCEYLLEHLCSWLNSDFFTAKEGIEIAYGIIKAIVAHIYIAWIHPFGDGNGRTARLIEFKILLSAGVPTPAAHLLSNHYNQTRQEYYRQLDASSKNKGDITPFLHYALQGYVDGLREQLAVVREQQLDVAWRNYIHEIFKDKKGEAYVRRRHLALDLSTKGVPIERSKIRYLSPRIAEAYAKKKGRRVISLDLNYLKKIDLIEIQKGIIRAKKEKIRAFLPDRLNTQG